MSLSTTKPPTSNRQHPGGVAEIISNQGGYFKQHLHKICCSKNIVHWNGSLTRPVRCPQSIRDVGTFLYEYKRIYSQNRGFKQQQ